MSDIATVFKAEIARIAKKQAKTQVQPVRKQAIELKHAVASLKRAVGDLQKQAALLTRETRRQAAAAPKAETDEGQRAWVFAKGIRSLRKRLGVSQAELGRLVGVSSQAVTLWESKEGRLNLRKATLQSILRIKKLGAREARAQLDSVPAAKPAKPAAKKRARRVAKK